MQWRRDAAGELGEGLREGGFVLGVDHTEHRFGLNQIHSAGEDGAKGELTRFGEAGAMFAQRLRERFENRRRTDGVDFNGGLASITARGGPDEEIARKRMYVRAKSQAKGYIRDARGACGDREP